MDVRYLIPQAISANVQKTPIRGRSVENAPSNDYHGQPNLLNRYINGTFPVSEEFFVEEWERVQTTTVQRNKKGLDIQIVLIYRHFSQTVFKLETMNSVILPTHLSSLHFKSVSLKVD